MRSDDDCRLVAAMAVAVTLAALCPAGSAKADRHCAPVLEQYYGARHAILSPGLRGHTAAVTCAAITGEAIPLLEEAATAAQDCGCDALRERIEDMTSQARSAASCLSRMRDVLDAATDLERLAEACH